MLTEINENEYNKLFNEKIDNETSWKFKSNLYVNSVINDVFEENKFLHAIIFDSEYNSFIKLKTGYPLFLKYTDKESVPEIQFDKPVLTLESYVEEMKKYGKNESMSKLLDFCVNNGNIVSKREQIYVVYTKD